MKSFGQSLRLITRDPVNLFLAVTPAILALAIYMAAIVWIFQGQEAISIAVRDYLPSAFGKVLTAILILFVIIFMSWTYVVVVGLIAAPFNSMISSRIETILAEGPVTGDRKKTLTQIAAGLGGTLKNETKKLVVIACVAAMAFILNFIPVLYPVAIFLLSLLFAVQFVDYSWSRHDLGAGACFRDVLRNLIPYSASGFLFLLLVTIPIINAFVPAWATSYFTVLWLKKQKKIPA